MDDSVDTQQALEPMVCIGFILAHLEDASFNDAVQIVPQLQTRFCFAASLRAHGFDAEAAEVDEEIDEISSGLSDVIALSLGTALLPQRINA